MRGWRVLAAIVAAWAVTVAPAVAACPGAHARLRDGNAAKVRRATLCLVNARRAKAGLRRLRRDRRLGRAATAHTKEMVAIGYFAHDGPAGDTVVTRAQRTGYLSGDVRRWLLAENIAEGRGRRGTPAGIVRQWMRSPGHRANLLLADARDAGIGFVRGRASSRRGVTATLDVGFAH